MYFKKVTFILFSTWALSSCGSNAEVREYASIDISTLTPYAGMYKKWSKEMGGELRKNKAPICIDDKNIHFVLSKNKEYFHRMNGQIVIGQQRPDTKCEIINYIDYKIVLSIPVKDLPAKFNKSMIGYFQIYEIDFLASLESNYFDGIIIRYPLSYKHSKEDVELIKSMMEKLYGRDCCSLSFEN